MKPYHLFQELSNEKRLAILSSLRHGARKMSRISEELDMTTSEAARHLERLAKVDLIARQAEGDYAITSFGSLVLSFLPSLEFLAENSGYFLAHDPSPLPPYLFCRLGELTKGRFLSGFIENINYAHEHLKKIQRDEILAIVPEFLLTTGEIVADKLADGSTLRVVSRRGSIDAFLESRGEKLQGLEESFQIKTLEDVTISMYIFGGKAGLALPGQDGKVDLSAWIHGEDKAFMDWARELFEFYWARAEPYSGKR